MLTGHREGLASTTERSMFGATEGKRSLQVIFKLDRWCVTVEFVFDCLYIFFQSGNQLFLPSLS
jgi:hypothetical protein